MKYANVVLWPTTDEGTDPLDNNKYALVGHRYLAFAIGTFD